MTGRIRKYWEWSRSVPAAAKPSADASGTRCAERQSGSQVTDIRLTVDGAALQNPTSCSAGSGCFELEDASWGQNGSAAGDGYWVFLKPLPPGRHEIVFGGKYIADGFTQDVKYLINVR